MKKFVSAILLVSMFSGLQASEIKDVKPQYDEELLNRLRGMFIISGASHFYHPRLNYGGYLVPKEQLNADTCIKKKTDAFYFLDHEGGTVRRVDSQTPSALKSKGLSQQEYSALWKNDMQKMKSFCIDSILGPTVDIGLGNGRSYSEDLSYNFKAIKPLLSVSKEERILPVTKHFPGLLLKCKRLTNSQEQHECSEDLGYIDSLWGKELKLNPPQALMISHYYYKTKDYQPAFANKEILEYLKNDKKYDGIIITDSLWELTQKISLEELMNMYKYTDLVLVMDYKVIETMIKIMHNKIKSEPELEKYLKIKEQRLLNWKKSLKGVS